MGSAMYYVLPFLIYSLRQNESLVSLIPKTWAQVMLYSTVIHSYLYTATEDSQAVSSVSDKSTSDSFNYMTKEGKKHINLFGDYSFLASMFFIVRKARIIVRITYKRKLA